MDFSRKLARAAAAMADTPGALQLRLLETIVEVAAEKNSTLVLPFPVELLRFLEHNTARQPAVTAAPAATEGASDGPATSERPALDRPIAEPASTEANSDRPAASERPALDRPTAETVDGSTADWQGLDSTASELPELDRPPVG